VVVLGVLLDLDPFEDEKESGDEREGDTNHGMGVASGSLNVETGAEGAMGCGCNILRHSMLPDWHVFCQSTGRAGKTLRCPV
jgi:hypothetical protein